MKEPRKAFYIFVPLASCLATIAVVEFTLSLFLPVPYAMQVNMYFEADPHTGFRLKPNSHGHFFEIDAITNSRGHRDEEAAIPKPRDLYRILFLGDSVTIGANVEQWEAYPEVLEDLLRRDSGRPLEVVNTAVGAWSPFQYAQYYEQYGRAFEPDLVMVGFFVSNDTYIERHSIEQTLTAFGGWRVSRKGSSSPFIRLKVFFYEHSNVVRLVLSGGASAKTGIHKGQRKEITDRYVDLQRRRIDIHMKYDEHLAAKAARNVEHILRIRQLARQDGAGFAVVLIPDENQINVELQNAILEPEDFAAYDFAMPQSMLKDMFAESEVMVIDLLPSFLNAPGRLYMNDTHLRPEGNELAARMIRDHLREQGLL
jgi:hypothetical protein